MGDYEGERERERDGERFFSWECKVIFQVHVDWNVGKRKSKDALNRGLNIYIENYCGPE